MKLVIILLRGFRASGNYLHSQLQSMSETSEESSSCDHHTQTLIPPKAKSTDHRIDNSNYPITRGRKASIKRIDYVVQIFSLHAY